MAITGMNHFNVLTDDVEATRRFYVDVVGLVDGDRPPLGFDGAWLYADGRPILHVSKARLPEERGGVIDHMAFSGSDLRGTVAQLEAKGVKYTLRQQVGTRIWQIFCHDPMGAKVELDFDPAESAPPGYAPAAA